MVIELAESDSVFNESDVCNTIGWILMVVGFLAGFLFIIYFGKVPRSGYYSYGEEWSGIMIAWGLAMMINGFLVGYIFQKIASILRYHEKNKIKEETN